MPIHDWTRVSAGTFHDFHDGWLAAIRTHLNTGTLPADFYAQIELVCDALSGIGLRLEAEADPLIRRKNILAIRHSRGDKTVSFLEIVASGNKSSHHAVRRLVNDSANRLHQGYHLVLLDLFPPGRHDPNGVHPGIWEEVCGDDFNHIPDKPLTLASYDSSNAVAAYLEPIAVGDTLPDMPLFLAPERYVSVPLETTYQAAYRGIPQRWKTVLEAV